MLVQIGPFNIMLWFKGLFRMGLLLRLGPNVIIDGIFISLGSSYYTCAFYTLGITEGNSVEPGTK